MNTILNGIVIKSNDYKEKDKLLTLFTLEEGIITAQLKGCKNANAKLKFAFQPFCFAEFTLADNTYKVVTNAELKESFFDLTINYSRYVLGCNMLNCIYKCIPTGNPSSQNFVTLLKGLNLLCYDNSINEKLIYAMFLNEFLKNSGYKLNTKRCSNCGQIFKLKKYYDFNSGGIVCIGCKKEYAIEISQDIFNVINTLNNMDFNNLGNAKVIDNSLDNAVIFLTAIINEHFSVKIN